ncbi:PQQ-dependent sugar dehydrogenase [Roseomonas populi]|uniref:PQQ-dependent sugar dehydrogenase n=1 Tax=Roseomonas populi TaxID=3121582 RepID=A0ABT1X2B6_9PROT|nr:PQQ-dependent sugar dehydrogenase [Roseomonas pecuniae]MCR0982243.1 PQQ-dependent sugar dehydrogenase [Roseomonas pecuniae]
MATVTGSLLGDRLAGTRGDDLIEGHAPLAATATAPVFTTIATGLGQAVFATSPQGEVGQLYVLDRTGVIRVVDTATGEVRATPFLDMSAEVATDGEQGLLGMAFHPDFRANGKFYVFFSRLDGDSQVREYTIDPEDPDTAPAGTARDILTIPQPGRYTNHKGGWMGFGPDGMLHIATGDGGGPNDATGGGQNPNDLRGSILRIDVNGDDFPGDAARNYAIPADNPFVDGGGAPEVWAYGLRNPYRDSFDIGTGKLWIGDVGQNAFEEVNIGAPGANYGWNTYEGGTGPAAGFTFPVYAYDHSTSDRSVIGGYVSRGPETGLYGQYLFGDYISTRFWTLADRDGDGALDRTEIDDGGALARHALVSFAEDGDGSLFVVGIDGTLTRISTGAPTGSVDGADTIAAGAGNDRVFAGASADRVQGGDGDDLLSGMEGNDNLLGGAGEDLLIGGAGADRLDGGDGSDHLLGGAGNDRLFGGAGADLLIGGRGTDILTGGAGADLFRWTTASDSPRGNPADRVADFNGAEGDRLDLSALVDGHFAFIGGAEFSASGPQLRALDLGGNWRVEISLDGGPADMVLLVSSAVPLTAADFIL